MVGEQAVLHFVFRGRVNGKLYLLWGPALRFAACGPGWLALSAVLCAGHASRAASYDDCRASAAGVDPKLKACDAAKIGARDAALNQSYRDLLAAIPAGRQTALRSAERAWVVFRDLECAFRASADAGGSDASLIESSCRLELTAERIGQLQKASKVAKF